jgi:hypothetical protein
VPSSSTDDPSTWNNASYEHHPMDDMEPISEKDLAEVGRSLSKILVWMAEPRSIVGYGQRLWVFLYSVRPDLIEGQTLDDFGKLNNATRQAMDKVVQQFQDNFGVKGRNTKRSETRIQCQQSHLKQPSESKLSTP